MFAHSIMNRDHGYGPLQFRTLPQIDLSNVAPGPPGGIRGGLPDPRERQRTNFAYKKGGTLLEEAEDDSWGSWFEELWSSVSADDHLPKRFRKFIKAHGREPITSVSMVRAPVDKLGEGVVKLITAGKWDELRKKAGIDAVFHTGLFINGKYVIEKLEKLEARVDPAYGSQGGKAEVFPLDLGNKQITIAEFLENGRTRMGKSFYDYHWLTNNCQSFVMELADVNGLLTPEGRAWIKQDLGKLIEETPELSKYLGEALTDVARNITNVGEEILAKRGGQILGRQRATRRIGF